MKTKTKIDKQLQKKRNPELVETIITAKKKKEWQEVAGILAGSRRNRKNLNLEEINKVAKDGDVVLVAGKVLSQGDVDKKIKIVSLDVSEKAMEKLKESKIEFDTILKEIKTNPTAKGLKILK